MNPELENHTSPKPIEETIFDALNLKTQASREYIRAALDNLRLFDKKQLDYGSRNISGFGTFGVVVRMNDKFERLKNLMGKKRRRPQNESIRDSLQDIANYAIIALLVNDGKWPNE